MLLTFLLLLMVVVLLASVEGKALRLSSDPSLQRRRILRATEDGGGGVDLMNEDDDFRRPWQINQNICPPVLCHASELHLNSHHKIEPGQTNYPFHEGDIVLDEELHQVVYQNQTLSDTGRKPSRVKRATILPTSRLWPLAIVPYSIDPTLDNQTQDIIHRAFHHFANHTCIKFRPKDDNDADYVDYVNQPGCWSNVGRTGGRQFISLGEECDQFGIIVHETAHALGFWHEQARPDRDKYVKILKKNIDPESLDQFSKRTEQESTSRGYAYDYNSIMHYSNNYYTDNGEQTIKLIGIGKKMQFKIGQRKRLSDLDIGQLNDMYYCHKKEAESRSCQHGWTKFRSSCYSFIDDDPPPQPFFPASRICRSRGARLVLIDDADEDAFLGTHLKNNFPLIARWRTGGVRMTPSSEFVWYLAGSGGRHERMKYTAWTGGKEPLADDQDSLFLVAVNMTHVYSVNNTNVTDDVIQFEWKGGSTGRRKPSTNHSYPFICEARAKIPCVDSSTNDGRDYRGHLSYTSQEVTCQRWSKHYPHNHTLSLDPDEGLGDHNHCRNPFGMRRRPWCYTLLKDVPWQYCDVPICRTESGLN